MSAPMPAVVVVIGVSGSGKTTIATLLAERLGWEFQDADSFHPRANVEKMHAGQPLTDDDRWPWLRAIARWIDEVRSAGRHAVLACSALKRAYRDVLVGERSDVQVVFLKGGRDLIARRLAARKEHFMPASLLESQFAALEPPGPDERPITVSIDATPGAIVEEIAGRLSDEARPRRVRLVVSDVDGTLVTHDKRLTEANRAAARRLAEAGIAFTIASSRPPVGLRMLVEPLGLRHPMGAFNGGALVAPEGAVLEQHLIPAEAARQAAAAIAAFGADLWVFADGLWLLDRPEGEYVAKERRTIQADPVVVPDLSPYLDRAGKIVGASADGAGLARCESEVQEAVGAGASVARSQPYYLDVTPPGIDKGTLVASLARRLGIDLSDVMTFGDADNDVPMFARSGFSVAMGNASPAVKAKAKEVTGSNEESGFATAVERLFSA